MSPIVVDKEAKRQDILTAAVGVFARKGIKHVRMAEIAGAAGIGKGTIYEYFRSKEELIAGAFGHFLEVIYSEVERRVAPLQDPEEKLRAFIMASFDAATANDDVVGLMFDIWADCIREGEGERTFDLHAMYDTYRRSLADIVQRGISEGRFRPVDPLATAAILVGAMDGLLLQWILDRTLFDLGRMGGTLADSLLLGITKRDEAG